MRKMGRSGGRKRKNSQERKMKSKTEKKVLGKLERETWKGSVFPLNEEQGKGEVRRMEIDEEQSVRRRRR